jgi:hypothetical protein
MSSLYEIELGKIRERTMVERSVYLQKKAEFLEDQPVFARLMRSFRNSE